MLNQSLEPHENLPEELQQEPSSGRRWRVHIIRFLILLVVLSFLLLTFGGVLRLLGMPNVDFLLESRKLAKDPAIQDMMQAVVRVESDNRGGTGFNVAPTGLIVTNEHITGTDGQVDVSFQSDRLQYSLDDWIADPAADLSFLTLADENLPFLTLEHLELPMPGDPVLLIGNPLGFFRIVTQAVFLGFTMQEGRETPVLVLKGPVYKGNSGSPVMNAEGKVIGIVFASTTLTDSGETAALAISSVEIAEYIDRVEVKTAPTTQ